jgi:hypothetical protein
MFFEIFYIFANSFEIIFLYCGQKYISIKDIILFIENYDSPYINLPSEYKGFKVRSYY